MPFFTSNNTNTTTSSRTLPTMRSPKTARVVADKKAKDANKDQTESQTQTTTSLFPEVTSPSVLKSVREFEHSRQRVHHTVHNQTRKDRKAKNLELRTYHPARTTTVCICSQCIPTLPPPSKRKAAVGARGARTMVGDMKGYRSMGHPELDSDIDYVSPWLDDDDAEVDEDWRWGEDKLKVDLTNLMVPSKPRKSKAGDFEIVPGIRPVLALDDRFSSDFEADEPWEYIDDDPNSTEKGPISYAEVVAR